MTAVPLPATAAQHLPALAAAPISAEARLAYVLRHFRLAYENVPDIAIGYSEDQQIIAVDGAGDFFSNASPYPPIPSYREWLSQRIPFFFDAQPKLPLLELGTGTVRINADILAAAFYLLSGWQEYFVETRDMHKRFAHADSVQKMYHFTELPLVNYYFDVLRKAIEHITGQALRPRRWGSAQTPFAAFITHDVDSLNGGWGTSARHSFRRRRYWKLLKLMRRRLKKRPAPWDNLEQVQAATARYGSPSTFFMLTNNQRDANGTPNADYDSSLPDLPTRLAALVEKGAEIGIHGSYGTARDMQRLRNETTQLAPIAVTGNRFHFLSWEPRHTPTVVADGGFAYDSTLGFAEQFGFRNSYCLPFFPWDFPGGKAYTFLEIPLNVMDTTLSNSRYLQLQAADVLPSLLNIMNEVQQFGGVITILWHNQNFDPLNVVNGPQQFHELMAELQRRGAAFVTGSQIVGELCQ